MGRGFLAGIFWGGLIGLSLIVLSNQMMDRRVLSFPQPQAEEIEVPAGTEFDQARPETEPVAPQAETRPSGEIAAGVQAPEDLLEATPSFDTSALEVPQPSTDGPATLGEAPEPAVEPEITMTGPDVNSVVEERPTLVAPDVPAAAPSTATTSPDVLTTAPETEAEPEQPVSQPEEDPVVVEAPLAPEGQSEEAAPEMAAEPEAPAVEEEMASLPEAPELNDEPEPSVEAPVEEEPRRAPLIIIHDGDDGDTDPPFSFLERNNTDDEAANPPLVSITPEQPEAAPEPETEPQPEVVEAPTDTSPRTEPEPDVTLAEPRNEFIEFIRREESSSPEAEATEEVADDTAAQETVQTAEEDVAVLEEPRTLPTIRRLPGTEAEESEETAPETTEDTTEEPFEPTGRAITDWRVEFEAAGDQPLVALVLLHEDGTSVTDVVRATPSTVAIAVRAGDPDAATIAAAYRDAGREIVMVPSLPAGASPQDVETALQSNFASIPESVAVMDATGDGFQADRDAVAQVVEVIAASGHGLITFPKGLNTALQQAERNNVPAGLVFRDVDGGGEDAEQVQRALDRAAFRARQDQAVILVGRTSGDTLVAITEWALGSRAQTVTLAPVSVALDGEG